MRKLVIFALYNIFAAPNQVYSQQKIISRLPSYTPQKKMCHKMYEPYRTQRKTHSQTGFKQEFIYLFILSSCVLLGSSVVLTVHCIDHRRQKLLPGRLDLRVQCTLDFAGDGNGDAVGQQLRAKQKHTSSIYILSALLKYFFPPDLRSQGQGQ